MSQDEFTKLYIYMEREFAKVHARLDETATKKELGVLTNAVDGLYGRVANVEQELTFLGHKVDRIEGWTHQIANQIGAKLKYS